MADERTPAPLPTARGTTLTAQQRRVLDAVRSLTARQGYPPTLREIGADCGLASPSSVAYQLAALELAGYLRRDRFRPRAVALVTPEPAAA